MTQPEELKKNEPLTWSTGIGTDVWELFRACIAGDLAAVQGLIAEDPSLVRCQFHYRKPLYFAVRENRLAIVEFLLERDPDPIGRRERLARRDRTRPRLRGDGDLLRRARGTTASAQGRAGRRSIRQRDGAKMRRPRGPANC
jgi:hypothetical protein